MRRGAGFAGAVLIVGYLIALISPNVGKILRVHYHVIDIGFLTHFRFIIAGVLLSLGWEWIGRILRRANFLLPAGAFVVLFGLVYFLARASEAAFYAKYAFMLVEPLLITVLLGWTLWHPAGFGLLRTAPVQWLGRCSYSIYLWQQLFTAHPTSYLKVPQPNALEVVALILACAAASYHFVERPLNAFGRRLLPARVPRPS